MISALIVNYHCASLTSKAVKSVLAEDAEVEVIVVDNSACDEELSRLLKLLPPEVTLLSNGRNEGFAKACNWAYRQSRGDMILLLNPDAYLLPGALVRMKATLAGFPRAGAVGPRIYWDDEKRFLLPPSVFPSPWQDLWEKIGRIHHRLGKIHSMLFRRAAIRFWLAEKPIRQTALSGGHMLLSRSAVEKSGGLFDERFFMYYEDSDLVLRLRHAGYHLFLEPRAGCVHRYQHSTNKSLLMGNSSVLYFGKNFRRNFAFHIGNWLPTRTPYRESMIPLGITLVSPKFEVPSSLRARWLLELSPSSSFVPAIAHFGSGETAAIPPDCWELLQAGQYFARLTIPDSWPAEKVAWTWEIPCAEMDSDLLQCVQDNFQDSALKCSA